MPRLGIDIGGTFTDAVAVDDADYSIVIEKVPTTPEDLSTGFLSCVQRLSTRLGTDAQDLLYIVHASTVATNAVLERRGARTGFLVTHGFRDLLEIGRQIRHELYNLQTEKPQPLAPREWCIEIPERLNARGDVLVPLDERAVIEAAARLRRHNVESVAVCFLHSYKNPVHEQRVGELLRQEAPDLWVSLSSEIAPEIREYWRASTAVTNAYVAPTVAKYLAAVETRLRRHDIRADLQIMQSSGGVMTMEVAKQRPVYMLESGPAAGVMAAKYFAERAGFRHAISFDMGGTTAKMGLIVDGEVTMVSEFEVGGDAGSGTGIARGSGYPILTPVVDVVEVGAGGGSIAWIDAGGLMRVGPRSAGAVPGPACYGKGGTEPTIADANLVLGRLNPAYFLGGEIPLYVDASRAAIEMHCARRLGLDPVVAAMGVIDIANATMADAMRLISVQRGHDPREFCLVVIGGAGPMHGNQLADELNIPVVIMPPSPGVASALGMLASDLRHDYCATHQRRLDAGRFDDVNRVSNTLRAQGLAELAGEGIAHDKMEIQRYLDLRYVGQSWKLRIFMEDANLGTEDVGRLDEDFSRHHQRSYGYSTPGEPVEIVNVGVLAIGRLPKLRLKGVPEGDASAAQAQKARRPVYYREAAGFVDTPVFDRYGLRSGNVIVGPAIVEEIDSTTVVLPGYTAEVATDGILILRKTA